MKRKWALALIVGTMLPLGTAANAWAQGATLVVSPSTIARGQTLTVTGAGYSGSTTHIAGGADLRLDTRDAEPLANAEVLGDGTFVRQFPIPLDAPLGQHLLIGTQVSTRNRHTFGSPGRTKLRIVPGATAAAAPGRPANPPPVVVAGTLLAVIGLMCGIAVCGRRLRTTRRAVAESNPLLSR